MKKNFIYDALIHAKAGDGGNGFTSFLGCISLPRGGPDGGDGGDGGNILLRSTSSVTCLRYFKNNNHFNADAGNRGQRKRMSGKNGLNTVIDIPLGTEVFLVEQEQSAEGVKYIKIADMISDNHTLLVAKGGKGGLGNFHFKSSTNRSPLFSGVGKVGAEIKIVLKLKIIADIGLIGIPNSGKSSFLNSITNAKSLVGDYPFTTKDVCLGSLSMNYQYYIIADTPGLIHKAYSGSGLGSNFLRHLERCAMLIHVIDITDTIEDIEKNYRIIRNEVFFYKKELYDKREIIILNKSDLLGESERKDKYKSCIEIFSAQMVFIVSSHNNNREIMESILNDTLANCTH